MQYFIFIPGMCEAYGNSYVIVGKTNCHKFAQAGPTGHYYTFTCPGMLKFDTEICGCNWGWMTKCDV